jgi:hypothetical protein
MIQSIIAVLGMALLFVLFGALRLADRRGCDGGCAGCSHTCEHHVKGGMS